MSLGWKLRKTFCSKRSLKMTLDLSMDVLVTANLLNLVKLKNDKQAASGKE